MYQLSHTLYRQNSKLWKRYKKRENTLQNKELDLNVSINIATNGKSKICIISSSFRGIENERKS